MQYGPLDFRPTVGPTGDAGYPRCAVAPRPRGNLALGGLEARAQRLLDVGVLPRAHGTREHGAVGMVGRRDDHGVEPGDVQDLLVTQPTMPMLILSFGETALARDEVNVAAARRTPVAMNPRRGTRESGIGASSCRVAVE